MKPEAESTKSDQKTAFIALGSNLGNSREIIYQAIARLQKVSIKPIRRSSLWQTTPVDCPPGSPPFVNAVIELVPSSSETPESLLEKLQQFEKEFGRQTKTILNEPRPLDLDLIAFNDEKRSSDKLTLPHPRAHARRFVLQPLCEIAPDLILPGQTMTVSQVLNSLATDEVLSRIGDT